MRLLQVIGTLDPAYGGPVEVAHQFAAGLIRLGHQVDTVSLDADSSRYAQPPEGTVHLLGPGLGRYRFTPRLVPWLTHHASRYSAVLVHGIWQYQSRAAWRTLIRLGIPYFVYVHGALDPWFKLRFPLKHLKKSIYWRLSEYHALRRAAGVFFTCEEERLLARQSFSTRGFKEAIVPYGLKDPDGRAQEQKCAFLSRFPHLVGKRIVLFMSRLHRKKGLDLLITAFSKVAARDPLLHLVIAGPDEEYLKQGLSSLARSCGAADQLTWTGMLKEDERWGAYSAAEVFALTSHSENFGMALVEALAYGVPVLTTKKVNIWREIESDKAGFVELDTELGAVRLLEKWLDLTPACQQEKRQRARDCFLGRFEITRATANLLQKISEGAGGTDDIC